MVLLGALPALASAATITVTTTDNGDSPPGLCEGTAPCTLRAAIDRANALPGADVIEFGGVPAGSTIKVEEDELPAIEGPLTIDGGTAAGATAGEPGIELEATGEFTAGLTIIGASETRIEGFAIGGFYDGILVEGIEGAEPSGDQICGNYLGAELDGETPAADNIGVQVGDLATGTAIGNGSTCAGNSIVANFDDGILDSGVGTTIAGNEIGIGPTGLSLPNGSGSPESAGILESEEASETMIGGVEPSGAAANLIWFNEGAGVLVEGTGGGVSIRHDSFLENDRKGIEVVGGEGTGPTVEAAFAPAPGELTVEGTATATVPGETVTLEFYGSREACGTGVEAEGQTYLGSGELTGVTGTQNYSFTLPGSVQADQPTVVATATREDGATSEFSACANYELAQTLTVNTRGDTKEGGCATVCSLREAIEVANLTRVKDTIDFARSAEGSIAVESESLPDIENPIEIDGTTAPGYAGSPLILIDGTGLVAEGETEGLAVEQEAGGSAIKGIAIGGFGNGIYLDGSTGSQICGSWVGVGLDGTTALPNDYGVEIGFDSPGNRIGAGCGAEGGDVISGNREWGIRDSGVGTAIAADRVGVDVAGEPLPNGTNEDGGGGIQESEGASGTVIGGGPGGGPGNVIADNRGPGIAVQSGFSRVKIRGNSIFGNGRAGIEIDDGGTGVPTIESVVTGTGTAAFTGEATAGDGPETIELDFFASPACGLGEGRTYLGSATVANSTGGAASYATGPIAATIPPGQDFITATATGSEGGQTTEFSGCFAYEPPPPVAIVTGPPASTEVSAATFEFGAPGASAYECSLDGAAFGPCASPASFGGLAVGPHTFAVRAVTAAGSVGPPTRYEWTVAGPPPQKSSSVAQDQKNGNPPSGLTPTNGKTIVVAPVEGKGKVLIKLPGTNKYVPLQELKEIPVGAVIDATKGRVRLTSRNPDGTEQTAEFFEGVFRVKQRTGTGLVVLELLDTRPCPAPGATGRATASSLALRPAGAGTAGKLWGSGHGNFRTEGNDGSATVRGTIWLVEDRCDETTFFKTRRDVVTVKDFITGKTFSLREGRTYLAGP